MRAPAGSLPAFHRSMVLLPSMTELELEDDDADEPEGGYMER